MACAMPGSSTLRSRIALIASFLFIELNGWRMIATESAAYGAIFGVAEGSITEPALAQ